MPRELPRYFDRCEDCEYLTQYCKCGEPLCENECGEYATKKVMYEDDIYWFCDKCEYEGEEVK